MFVYLLGSQALGDAAYNDKTTIRRSATESQLEEDQVVASVVYFTMHKPKIDSLDPGQRFT